MRPNLYLVKKPQHMSDEVLQRFVIREHIVPIFDMFPDYSLQGENAILDIDMLLQDEQVMSLPNDAVDEVERLLNTIMEITAKDWVIIPMDSEKKVIVGKVERYEHIRYQGDRYVKHFLVLSNRRGEISYEDLSREFITELHKSHHLDVLSPEFYNLIQRAVPEAIIEPPKQPAIQHKEAEATEEQSEATTQEWYDQPAQRTIDNQIVTPQSFSATSRQLDSLSKYKKLHESKEVLYDYLLSHVVNLRKVPNDDCDLKIVGTWHDGVEIIVRAYQLTDNRNHSAWVIRCEG